MTDSRKQFMNGCLKKDDINDTSITIPASILIIKKDLPGKILCEFDGMIIHPMRKNDQLIFLEAKNTSKNPSKAKKELAISLDKLNYP